jgi:hypothetical protein
MSGTQKNIYAGGNTARGFFHFYDSLLEEIGRVFVLKNAPRSLTASLIKQLGDEALQAGHDLEWIHCAAHNEYLDGIIIRDMKLGIFDALAFQKVDLSNLAIQIETLDLKLLKEDELSAPKTAR